MFSNCIFADQVIQRFVEYSDGFYGASVVNSTGRLIDSSITKKLYNESSIFVVGSFELTEKQKKIILTLQHKIVNFEVVSDKNFTELSDVKFKIHETYKNKYKISNEFVAKVPLLLFSAGNDKSLYSECKLTIPRKNRVYKKDIKVCSQKSIIRNTYLQYNVLFRQSEIQ